MEAWRPVPHVSCACRTLYWLIGDCFLGCRPCGVLECGGDLLRGPWSLAPTPCWGALRPPQTAVCTPLAPFTLRSEASGLAPW
eukprot:3128723-Prymnesium_polylepis.2